MNHMVIESFLFTFAGGGALGFAAGFSIKRIIKIALDTDKKLDKKALDTELLTDVTNQQPRQQNNGPRAVPVEGNNGHVGGLSQADQIINLLEITDGLKQLLLSKDFTLKSLLNTSASDLAKILGIDEYIAKIVHSAIKDIANF